MILQKVKHPSRGVLIALIFSALLFTSCENLFFENQITENIETEADNTGSAESSSKNIIKTIDVTGRISLSGAYPQSVAEVFTSHTEEVSHAEEESHAELVSVSTARTAFPSIPTTGITYTVTAVNTATGSTESYTGEALTDDDNVTYRVAIPATETEKNYKVKVTAIYDSKEILSGESEEFPVSMANPVASKNIVLGAAQSAAGSGTFALEISIASDSGIVKCNTSQNSSPVAVSDGKITLTSGPLASKAHKIDFSFYDSSDNLLYKFSETINIFDNLITNTWVQNGSEPWFVTTTNASGKKITTCRITKAMVEGFKLTDIYVDSGRQTENPTEPGYTTQSGTWLNPKVSLNDALAMLHNAGKDYTIYIKGELRGAQTIPATLKSDGSGTTNARSLTICGASGLDDSGQPQDTLNGNFTSSNPGTTLSVRTSVPVTIKNLKITNGNATNGGGINNRGNLTLDSGCLITGNNAQRMGGGVYNEGGRLTVKSGVEISDNHVTSSVSDTGGGGIFNYDGIVELKGGLIKDNTTNQYGGGIYFDGYDSSDAYISIEAGAVIEGNSAVKGGGIYINGEYAAEDGATKVTLKGGRISSNIASQDGGGVYNYAGTFEITAGEISENTAGADGSAVYHKGYNFSIGGRVDIPCAAGQTNPVYLASNKKITITNNLTGANFITIKLQNYSSRTEILSGTEELLASEYYKFYAPKPDDVEDHLFVLDDGKLSPIVSYPNGTPCGTVTNSDDGLDYNEIKYSFKDADNLMMNIPNAYKENDYVDIKVDGEAPETAEIDISGSGTETETITILGDGYHTVTVTLTNYASEPIVIEKRMYVRIKPIKLNYRNNEWGQLGNQWVCMSGFQAGTGRMDIRGRVELFSSPGSSSNSIIFDYQYSNYEISIEQWYQLDWDSDGRYWETTLSSKDDYVWIVFNLWRNESTGMGSHTCPGRTLAEIKKVVVDKCGSGTQDNLVQSWTCWSGNRTNGTGQTAAVMVNFNVEELD